MSHLPPVRQLPVVGLHSPFPPVHLAWGEADPIPGLLCAGADLSIERLVAAYSQGIFPWFSEGEPILWWSPNPRMVLEVADFKLHRSLQQTLKRFHASAGCEVRMNSDFQQVIEACAHTPRSGSRGTWIVNDMKAAYLALHNAGMAHSIETWQNGELIGGLYFTHIRGAVFGESMFSRQSDASKIALASLLNWCESQSITWIDCQQQTKHLASLGAAPIPREEFLQKLKARHAS
jgi:leucyl/phenylalanyl-tRNA---protein transferase